MVNQISVTEWGFEVETLRITSFLADKQTIADRQKVAKEKAQRQSEMIEAEANRDRIQYYITNLGMTPEQAARHDQAERGKIERDVVEVDTGGKSGGTKALDPSVQSAAVLKSGLGDNPNQQKSRRGKKKGS